VFPEQAPTLAIVWHHGQWRCDYSKAPGQLGTVHLYFDGAHLMLRRVSSVDEMRQVGQMWREMITSESRGGLRIHRLIPDRRQVARGGRRAGDRQQ
jgi:hypothetical protein